LNLETEPVMLVGHNPFMENLASALLTCRIGQLPIYFTTSTTACLETVDDGWTVRWVLNREFARE
jgi:phosphohistidine phosphatase SixA